MSMKKAQWAARLICNPDREHYVIINAVDDITIQEIENNTPVAQTTTTEPLLLRALLRQILL